MPLVDSARVDDGDAADERAARDIGPIEPPTSRALAFRLYLVAVFLMSLQLELDAFKNIADTRFPPGDFLLLLSILILPTSVRVRRSPIALLPLALVAVMAYGVLLAVVYAGHVSNNAMQVKLFGTITLAMWCLLTIYYAQQGHGRRILRAWISGMVIWGAVAFVDWKFIDFIPGLEAKTPTRFGGMQFDPNNAGAAYAVVVLILWRYGHRLYSSRATRSVALGLACTFLGFTWCSSSRVTRRVDELGRSPQRCSSSASRSSRAMPEMPSRATACDPTRSAPATPRPRAESRNSQDHGAWASASAPISRTTRRSSTTPRSG